MPRASTTNDNEETPKRAPRKRAVRRVVTKSDAPIRRTRQTRTTTISRQIEQSDSVSARRAPTRLVEETTRQKSNRKKFIIAASFFLIMLGTAAFVGMSDNGQIDVNAEIEKSKSQKTLANEEVGGEINQVTVPVQNTTPPAAISGLRPMTASSEPVVETPPVPTSSTTDEISTTTESVEENTSGTEGNANNLVETEPTS